MQSKRRAALLHPQAREPRQCGPAHGDMVSYTSNRRNGFVEGIKTYKSSIEVVHIINVEQIEADNSSSVICSNVRTVATIPRDGGGHECCRPSIPWSLRISHTVISCHVHWLRCAAPACGMLAVGFPFDAENTESSLSSWRTKDCASTLYCAATAFPALNFALAS